MSGIDEEVVISKRNKAIERLQEMGYETISSYFKSDTEVEEFIKRENPSNLPVSYLGRSVQMLAKCSLCYFVEGWEHARGCRLEHAICQEYGIECIYENDTED